MRCVLTIFVMVLAACSTTSGGSPTASQVAQSFAEYYTKLIRPPIEVIHVVPDTSEAVVIAEKLRLVSRPFLVRTDGRYLETKSEVVDVATQKRCIVLRLRIELLNDLRASVTVARIDGSWTMMRYFLSYAEDGWKVTGSEFIAAS